MGKSPRFLGLLRANSSSEVQGGKNRTGMEASVGMRETVPSLKFKESEALSKQNLKDREGTTPLPLCENEKAATFVVIIKKVGIYY